MSNPSKYDIINMALAHVGVKAILGAGDTSDRATTAEKFYDATVASLLDNYPWRFSGARVLLAPDPAAPEFEWGARYKRPPNMAAIRSIHGLEETEWTLEGKYILTDEAGAIKVVYSRNDIPEGEFDPIFVEMLALRLATFLVSPTGKGGVGAQQQRLDDLFRDAEDRAERADAFEFPREKNRDKSPYEGVLA